MSAPQPGVICEALLKAAPKEIVLVANLFAQAVARQGMVPKRSDLKKLFLAKDSNGHSKQPWGILQLTDSDCRNLPLQAVGYMRKQRRLRLRCCMGLMPSYRFVLLPPLRLSLASKACGVKFGLQHIAFTPMLLNFPKPLPSSTQ